MNAEDAAIIAALKQSIHDLATAVIEDRARLDAVLGDLPEAQATQLLIEVGVRLGILKEEEEG